jgi:hypothetical protein
METMESEEMEQSKQREALEQKLDEALLKVFDMERQIQRDRLLRYELEEFIRSIFRDCKQLLASEEEKPSLENVLENIIENIRKLQKEYNIHL